MCVFNNGWHIYKAMCRRVRDCAMGLCRWISETEILTYTNTRRQARTRKNAWGHSPAGARPRSTTARCPLDTVRPQSVSDRCHGNNRQNAIVVNTRTTIANSLSTLLRLVVTGSLKITRATSHSSFVYNNVNIERNCFLYLFLFCCYGDVFCFNIHTYHTYINSVYQQKQ